MIQKEVQQKQNGVAINFKGEVAKSMIFTMVQNCQEGKCECMSDATKAKIESMQIEGEDGDVKLHIEGEISKDEIQKALEKSKVLN